MLEHVGWIGWAAVYAAVGGLVGTVLIVMVAGFLPRLIARFTPAIDEEKEILRGNRAVAEYFGRVVSAAIVGISIVIAGAVAAGLIAALH